MSCDPGTLSDLLFPYDIQSDLSLDEAHIKYAETAIAFIINRNQQVH